MESLRQQNTGALRQVLKYIIRPKRRGIQKCIIRRIVLYLNTGGGTDKAHAAGSAAAAKSPELTS